MKKRFRPEYLKDRGKDVDVVFGSAEQGMSTLYVVYELSPMDEGLTAAPFWATVVVEPCWGRVLAVYMAPFTAMVSEVDPAAPRLCANNAYWIRSLVGSPALPQP